MPLYAVPVPRRRGNGFRVDLTLSLVAFTKFVESDAEDKIQRLTSGVVFDISMSGLAIMRSLAIRWGSRK